MLGYLSRILSEGDASLRRRLIGVYALLIAANVLVWVWALALLHETPVLLGTALLAYSFGLRHAVDADRIAAIDNLTRKLMQQGQRPIGVALWFSLGHSAVIAALSVAVAFATSAMMGRFESSPRPTVSPPPDQAGRVAVCELNSHRSHAFCA